MRTTTSLALLAALVAVPAQADTIRVGMSGGYFPFTFVQQDELQGFEVDFMRAVAEETGDEVEFVTMAFSGLVGALDSGRIDTISNQITITPEREAVFLFSQPYVIDGAQIVVREGNEDEITDVEDLRGRTVAVNLGSNFRAAPARASLRGRDRHPPVREQHRAGHRARPRRRLRDGPDFVGDADPESPLPLALAGEPFSEIRNALPFRNNADGEVLRERIDAAITTLKENGTLRGISERWFGLDITSTDAN